MPAIDPTEPLPRGFKLASRFAMSKTGRWFGINVSSRVDPVLQRWSRGRLSTFPMARVVMLTVPGRKSGTPRTLPLLYFTEGDEVILIASSFGRAKHPAWYLNVKAHPEVALRARGREGCYLARETEGEERDRLYALAEKLYEGYGDYEEMAAAAGRKIPVLALAPLD